MNATQPKALPHHLTVVATLAHLLQKLEGSRELVDAGQYRSLVARLGDELGSLNGDPALEMVLASFPAAAELYENLNYRHAGLCRSPLAWSLAAELKAREVLARVARRKDDGAH